MPSRYSSSHNTGVYIANIISQNALMTHIIPLGASQEAAIVSNQRMKNKMQPAARKVTKLENVNRGGSAV